MTHEQKTQAVREILLKYTTPLPRYDGFNAWTIAELIVDQLDILEVTK